MKFIFYKKEQVQCLALYKFYTYSANPKFYNETYDMLGTL